MNPVIIFAVGSIIFTGGYILATKPNTSFKTGNFFNMVATIGFVIAYAGFLGITFPQEIQF